MPKSAPIESVTSLGASFRDPAGYVFKNSKGEVLRRIKPEGRADFDLFVSSGLYKELANDGLIIPHTKVPSRGHNDLTIKPVQVPFITYPFEWSFSQLKDAALLTLELQRRAMRYDMMLKDASAYNMQFMEGRPVLIDTLSFMAYEPDTPWQAYRQFCQHFLAPLALMAYTDTNLSQLSRVFIDGIPLDMAATLLPRRAKLRPGIAMHLVLHSRAQKAKGTEHKAQARKVTKASVGAIIDNLEGTIKRLKPRTTSTEWGDYYDRTNYTPDAADKKARQIKALIKPLKVKTALDLGGNDGRYSRPLNDLGILTACTDIDPNAVEANYRVVKQHNEPLMLPMLVDLINPGGAMGWHNNEREPIHERLKTDVVMVLALIHHLAISNNLPFGMIANYFKEFAPYLVLEFVPKEDSQVKKLLSTRKDIFPDYNEEGLVAAFSAHYKILKEARITGTKRTLYLMKRK